MTFIYILINLKSLNPKIYTFMKTKQQNKHGVEIYFSAINPLELWKNLRLEQPVDAFATQEPEKFESEEEKEAYEAFRNDLKGEKNDYQELAIIPCEKGSLFIWSLLKEESRRSPRPKLSSKKFLFKDDLFKRICKKTKECCSNLDFSEKDFEDIALYLENKKLVLTSIDGIRTTQHFAKRFHECYNAWLNFGRAW